jgi:hypothetical protein
MSEKQKRKEKAEEQTQVIPFLGKLFSMILLAMLILGYGGNQYNKFETLIMATFIVWSTQDAGTITQPETPE